MPPSIANGRTENQRGKVPASQAPTVSSRAAARRLAAWLRAESACEQFRAPAWGGVWAWRRRSLSKDGLADSPFLSLLSLWTQALESANRPCPQAGDSAESLGPAPPLLLVFWGATGNLPNPHKPWCSHSLSGVSALLVSCGQWRDLGRRTCEHNLEGVELAGLGVLVLLLCGLCVSSEESWAPLPVSS